MKVILSFIFVLMGLASIGQSTLPLRADTVLVEKTGGSGELKIKNSTRDSLGLLVNIGGGRTRFMRVRQITDTSFVIPNGAGGDTIRIVSGGSGGGSGSVTQVNTGYGLDGGPITTTGTILVDSAELASYFLRRKDSSLYATTTRLRDSAAAKVSVAGHAATSILGRSANSTGNVADIVASADGQSLVRNGTSLGFGSVNLAKPAAITGNLPVDNLNTGVNANAYSFWSGDASWKDIGVAAYFKVGESSFPDDGDSLYTNLSFAGYQDYDIYRDGVLQYWDTLQGIEVDNATGQVIFHPPLVSDERIMVKATRKSALRAPPFASFDINTVSNVRAWYDATDPTTITTATGVSAWADKTPNGYNLTQATGGNQPSYSSSGGSNNMGYVHFTTSKSMAFTLPVEDSAAVTGYMVIKQPTFANGSRIFAFRTQSGENGLLTNATTATTSGLYSGYTTYDGTVQSIADLNTGWGDWQLISFTIRGSGANNIKKNKLAGFRRQFEFPAAGSPATLKNSFIKVNSFADATFDLSEFVLIKGQPSGTEDLNIRNYLMTKYAITQRNTVLFLGDSHTEGVMAGTPTGDSYVILTGKEKGYDIMNQGQTGTVAYPIAPYGGSTGGNLSDKFTLFDSYLAPNNPILVFAYGTNDGTSPLNAAWVTSYKASIQHFIDLGIPRSRIIICSPPYNSASGYATNLANAEPVIAGIAADLAIQYCDWYHYTLGLGLDCNAGGGDGIHGNANVHRAMADLLKTLIP